MSLQKELNRLAGTTGLDAQGAANVLAGTTGLDLVGALNRKAGTVGLGLLAVLNRLASPVVETNAHPNPTASTDATWAVVYAAGATTIGRATGVAPPVGKGTAFNISYASGITSAGAAFTTQAPNGAGDTWTASAWVKRLSGPNDSFAPTFRSVASGTSFTLPTGSWVRVSVTSVIGATQEVAFGIRSDGTTSGAGVFLVSGVLIERSSVVNPYFDGDTPDTPDLEYAWTGAPNASTSTKRSLLHLGMDAAAARIV